MGMFAALGVILAHAPDGVGARAGARSASPPPRRCRSLAVTLYFTFSRGGIGVAIVGVVALRRAGASARAGRRAAGGRASRWRSRCRAPTAPTCSRSYDYAGADARAQGRSLLVVVIACAVAAAVLRGWRCGSTAGSSAMRIGARTRTSRSAAPASPCCSALAVGDRRRSTSPPDRRRSGARSCAATRRLAGADLRTRLTTVGNNGRLDNLARRARRARRRTRGTAPARARSGSRGSASGPSPPAHVIDGHSLYYEVRAELGWIGIGAAAGRLRGAARGGDRRLWGPERHAHGAFLAAGGALLLPRDGRLGLGDAGAVRLVLRRRRGGARRRPRRRPSARAASRGGSRALLAGLAPARWRVTPLTVAFSQSRLDRGARRRCGAATARRRRTPRSAASTRCRVAGRARSRCSAAATPAPGSTSSRWRRCATPSARDPATGSYAYGQAIVAGAGRARTRGRRRRRRCGSTRSSR